MPNTKLLSDQEFASWIGKRIDSVDRAAIEFAELNHIEVVSEVYSPACDRSTHLQRIQRRAFNANKEIEDLKGIIECCTTPFLLGQELSRKCMEVQAVRDRAAPVYLYCDDLHRTLKSQSAALSHKIKPTLRTVLDAQVQHAHGLLRSAIRLFHDLPDCGVSFEEWQMFDEEVMRDLRPVGRPRLPDEVKILRLQRELDSLVRLAYMRSSGEIRTLDDLLAGVSESNQGRPPVSELAKLDRALISCRMQLDKLNESAGGHNDRRKAALTNRIADLTAKLAAGEAGLDGVDKLKRDMEKARAVHRDLTVAGCGANGRAWADVQLRLMRNEVYQQKLAAKIVEMDPAERVSLTHKVNPRARQQRFEELSDSPHLTANERSELQLLNKAIVEYQDYRKRPALRKTGAMES